VRALGAVPPLHVDVQALTAEPGDVLLLSTDGLTDVVDVHGLDACPAGDVGALVEQAVQAARRLESGDDITVVAARLG
jgi:serine/threonine protein phosphatase PrpC